MADKLDHAWDALQHFEGIDPADFDDAPPELDEDEAHDDEAVPCELCSGDAHPLGKLGDRLFYKCECCHGITEVKL